MNIWRELIIVRTALETLQHSAEAADKQEAAWLSKIINQYELNSLTDEIASQIIEAANRHRWRMANVDVEGTPVLQMKYFVLKPRGEDVCAVASRRAMRAYALTVRQANPQFAHDLMAWADAEWMATAYGKCLAAIGEPLNADIDDVPQ